jgi:hypothetical protein
VVLMEASDQAGEGEGESDRERVRDRYRPTPFRHGPRFRPASDYALVGLALIGPWSESTLTRLSMAHGPKRYRVIIASLSS